MWQRSGLGRALTGWLAACGAGLVQAQAPPGPVVEPPATARRELLAGQRLGLRVQTLTRQWATLDVVVLVPDEVSFVAAVGRWRRHGRFPVLFEGTTPAQREDAARFVRAFGPKRVVHWSAGQPGQFADAAARRQAVEQALLDVWREAEATGGDVRGLIERWRQAGPGLTPAGLAVADPTDPAWPAALTLAAGRALPLVWVRSRQDLNGAATPDQVRAFHEQIVAECERLGLRWGDVGDDVDALVLALNVGAKVDVPDAPAAAAGLPGTPVAMTDLLGRHPHAGEGGSSWLRGSRWAWCGQVHGDEASAAYRAMCAVFLGTGRAWVFDSYPDSAPWQWFDGTAAAEALRRAGVDVILDDAPAQGLRQWRARSAGGIDAGLIMVNTKGLAHEFELSPGSGHAADVPFLNVPAAVYFVHSFAAAWPGERSTIAARFFERGAYAFVGSVHEPGLHGFVPTPVVARRLGAGMALGAAVRAEGRPPWKVALFGDPLITLGPGPRRVEGDLPLAGARDVDETARKALEAGDCAATLRDLVLAGKDGEAARLASALLRDRPEAVSAAIAREAVMPLFRARDATALVRAFEAMGLPPDRDRNIAHEPTGDGLRAYLRDALWHACEEAIVAGPAADVLGVLRAHLRDDQPGHDAARIAPAVARRYGREAAQAMLAEALARSPAEWDRAAAREAQTRLGTRGADR